MITRLQGTLLEKSPTDLVLDVHGVGYRVFIPLSVFAALPEPGQGVVLHTEFIVREDAQQLYGFIDRNERRLFQALIKVNGIGPRLGLNILSGMEAAVFVQCIHDGDVTALVRLPGIGKKTAERLVVEMRDRLKDWGVAEGVVQRPVLPPEQQARHEAESALLALGYKPAEAARAVIVVEKASPGLPTEDIIRQALRHLSGQ